MSEFTPARLDELENVLQEHVGPQDAITSGELASACGIADGDANPDTRAAIRTLVEDRNLPVAATSQGYYLMTSREQLESYLEDLDSRIAGIQERKHLVVEAFQRGGFDGDDGTDSATFQCPDCGFSTSEADDMALLSDGTLGCPNCDRPTPDASGEGVTA